MQNSLLYYLICLTIVLIIIIVVIILVRGSQKRKRATPSLTREPRLQDLPTADRPKSTVPGSSAEAKKPHPAAEAFGRIFVSYRRSDSADVSGRIYDRLIARFGKNLVFKDVDSIPLGIDFKEYLDRKVSECDVLLAIIGDHWIDARDANGKRRLDDPADFVRIEIESALERGIPVIPLLVHGAQMPAEENLPFSLRKLVYRNGIPIRPDPDFHRDMDRLISALDKYVQ